MKLVEGIDYEWDEEGNLVFSSSFLLARGKCCKNGCRNCPYGFKGYNYPHGETKVQGHEKKG